MVGLKIVALHRPCTKYHFVLYRSVKFGCVRFFHFTNFVKNYCRWVGGKGKPGFGTLGFCCPPNASLFWRSYINMLYQLQLRLFILKFGVVYEIYTVIFETTVLDLSLILEFIVSTCSQLITENVSIVYAFRALIATIYDCKINRRC